MKTLKGTPSSSSSTSGYSALPSSLQSGFNSIGQAVSQYTNPANEGVTEMFTPLATTSEEKKAYDMINAGITPTSETLQSDINMQMNPYNQYVIDEINRQAKGSSSILNQALSAAGGLGSSSQMLGASDIDLARTNQIGTFLSEQYNTALNNAMNTIPSLRNTDITNLMNAGTSQRALDLATKQAPITALQSGTSMISPFTSGGTSSSTGGQKGLLDYVVDAAGSVAQAGGWGK